MARFDRTPLLLLLLLLVFGLALAGCDELEDGEGDDPGGQQQPATCDAAEVDCDGDYFIGSCPEWNPVRCPTFTPAGVRPCTRIRGELTINESTLSSISLPNLRRIDGDLYILGNPDLALVDMPCLEHVGDWVWIQDNPSFLTCRAEALINRLTNRPGRICNGDNRADSCAGAPGGC